MNTLVIILSQVWKTFEIYDLKIIDIKRVKIQKGSILGLVAHKNSLYLKNLA